MSETRKALQELVSAIEWRDALAAADGDDSKRQFAREQVWRAVDQAKAALAQEAPASQLEPVAWIPAYRLPIDEQSTGKLFAQQPSGEFGQVCIPLYAAPISAQPPSADAVDAARYRWLREHTVATGLERFVAKHNTQFLDAAIDAELEAPHGEQ